MYHEMDGICLVEIRHRAISGGPCHFHELHIPLQIIELRNCRILVKGSWAYVLSFNKFDQMDHERLVKLELIHGVSFE